MGKGWPGDHTEAGVVVVRDMAPRLGFDTADADILVTLTLLHLLLPDTATRRDLDDPATISSVAAGEHDRGPDLLHALTEADGLATGPAAWNDWKAGLVAELVRRTRAVLNGATPMPIPPLTPNSNCSPTKGNSRSPCPPGPTRATSPSLPRTGSGCSPTSPGCSRCTGSRSGPPWRGRLEVAVDTWLAVPEFGTPPDGEALREDLRRAVDGQLDVADRLARRRRTIRSAPGFGWRQPGSRSCPGLARVRRCWKFAHDRPGLLHRIARTLAVAGVDVRTARVSTLGAEAVDVFYVTDREGRPLEPAHAGEVARIVRDAVR